MQDYTKKGLYAISKGCSVKMFKTKEDYLSWKDYTEKNGHDMQSFYNVKCSVNQYHEWTPEEFKTLLAKN